MIDNETYSVILPARIVEYFPENQTATIQISVEVIHNSSTELSKSKARLPIENVPVHTPSGGGWSITMPIKTGDTCLVFFSQVGYDHWLYEDRDLAGTLAGLPKPWLGRQFSEEDGFALVGMNTLPRAINNYSAEDSQWRNDDVTQVISLNSDNSINIDSTVSLTVNAPSVVVNSTNSEINASSVVVNSAANQINGPLHVTGPISSDVSLACPTVTATSVAAGLVAASAGLSVGGLDMGSHTHTESGGGTTSGPQ